MIFIDFNLSVEEDGAVNSPKLALLAATAALAVACFAAGSASATVLCEKNEAPCPALDRYGPSTDIHAAATAAGVEFGFAIGSVNCKASTLTAETENPGSSTETVQAKVWNLQFTECAEQKYGLSCLVLLLVYGDVEFHSTSAGNGTLTGNGTEIRVECPTWPSKCVIKAENKDLATVTGGNPAAIDLSATLASKTVLCGSTGLMKAQYEIASPSPLFVQNS
jgi:hypothetical protein